MGDLAGKGPQNEKISLLTLHDRGGPEELCANLNKYSRMPKTGRVSSMSLVALAFGRRTGAAAEKGP